MRGLRPRDDVETDLSFDDDDEQTIPCPYCKREVHEDAPRCPYCEQYISEEDAPRSRKPWWMILGLLLCLYAIYRWVAG
jgi:aspartate carbamoyltransferase regulatory subunit